MNSRLVVLLLSLAALLPAGNGWAADIQAEMSFRPARAEAVWVGEKLELHLELWSNALSFSGQWYVLPEVQGAFLLQAESVALKLSEQRDGAYWQGLRYTFQLYPQREGVLEVPSFEVSFSAREAYGSPERPFEFTTPALAVEARLPPGANADGLIVASTDFSMQAEWSPPLGDDSVAALHVGDALTLSILRRAADVPGMVFAPLPVPRQDGLGVYPGNPRVEDVAERGDMAGTRRDTLTVVCEQPGVYRLPELRFQWWNPQRESLSEQVVPAVEIRVTENPAFAAGPVDAGSGFGLNLGRAVGALLLAVLLFLTLRQFWPGWIAAWDRWREVRRQGETWAFRQAIRACSSGDAGAAYHAINAWLLHSDLKSFRVAGGTLTLTHLAGESGDAELAAQATALQQAVMSAGSPGATWTGKKMAAALKRLRRLGRDQEGEAAALSQLNPRGFTRTSGSAGASTE